MLDPHAADVVQMPPRNDLEFVEALVFQRLDELPHLRPVDARRFDPLIAHNHAESDRLSARNTI